ncbi:MAG: LD-carboxypeptidase [Cyclobacteriaceae bacterium]|nr:LD-carboxypeptidase [Cyclobacteriaceae bacterium]
MIKAPEKLVKDDLVAIIPPAKAIDPVYISHAVGILEGWGLRVKLSDNIQSKQHQYAGNDDERISSFQHLLDDDEIKCIISARGGYGTTRIIDQLDFARFMKYPKWIVGYSDITALLLKLHRLGFQGIHGPMPINFSDEGVEESLNRLKNLLFSGYIEPIIFAGDHQNVPGKARGRIIGGNLSLLVNSIGTADDFSADHRILFIEDVDEYYFRIDRMMVQLKRSGNLSHLSGMIVGNFSMMHDNEDPFGADIQKIILDQVKEFKYPVCFGAPFGHEIPNFPIPVGGSFSLEVKKDNVILRQLED